MQENKTPQENKIFKIPSKVLQKAVYFHTESQYLFYLLEVFPTGMSNTPVYLNLRRERFR